MSKRAFLSALSGHLYGCLQPFLIALCVCRGDGTEPFRVGARKGEVELNSTKRPSSEKPRTRVLRYSVRIFVFVSNALHKVVPKQLFRLVY